MLTIRLQRSGKRNKPEFRIVLAQKTAAVNKKFLEVLGHYNPRTKDFVIKNETRLQYWIAQHVTLSPTVNNLFVSKNLVPGSKVKAFKTPKKEEPAADKPAAPAGAAAPLEANAASAGDASAPAETATPAQPEAEIAPAPIEPEAPIESPVEPQAAIPESSPEVAPETPAQPQS